MPHALGCAFAGLAFLAPCAAASVAEAPAGIVMAVTGTTDPPLSLMAEIPANAPIRLEPGSKLIFLEYQHCKLVTVTGGVLTLTQSDYKTDGHVEGEKDGPCPQTYSITSSDAAGAPGTAGLIMRGATGPPHWPVNAQLALTGSRAREFQTATVLAEDQPGNPAASFVIADGKVVASPGALPLLPNRRYVLRLMPSDRSKSNELVFVGSPPSQPAPLVILRLD